MNLISLPTFNSPMPLPPLQPSEGRGGGSREQAEKSQAEKASRKPEHGVGLLGSSREGGEAVRSASWGRMDAQHSSLDPAPAWDGDLGRMGLSLTQEKASGNGQVLR